MKLRLVALCLLLTLALCACAGQPERTEPSPPPRESAGEERPPLWEAEPEPEPEPETDPPPASEPEPESSPPPEPELPPTPPPAPEDPFRTRLEELEEYVWESTQPEEVIWAYFELQYLAYTHLRQVDLSTVLDSTKNGNMYNLEIWQQQLVQRRSLLEETGLCYVEREQYDYEIVYITDSQLTDPRLEYWRGFAWEDGGELTLHFVIKGEEGKAYPPLMAVNAQHSVRLRREGDSWRIVFHYFPGAVRKFYQLEYRYLRPDEEVVAELYQEFEEYPGTTSQRPGPGSLPYRGRYAAEYARIFAEEPNPDFYHVGDWNGNCMNFVSQCVLHGFGSGKIPDSSLAALMPTAWFSGGGGGTAAWENVDYFWAFATRSGGPLRCQVLPGPHGLRTGDLVQTRNTLVEENEDPEDYSHCLIVVDGKTLLLAQNTPANFVYYSDLVGTKRRFLRPLYLN